MIIDGWVTSVFLHKGDRYLTIKVSDPRYPNIDGEQSIVVKDKDEQQQLGDLMKIILEGK